MIIHCVTCFIPALKAGHLYCITAFIELLS